MALPVTITGLATTVPPVGPFKVAAGTLGSPVSADITTATTTNTALCCLSGNTANGLFAQTFTATSNYSVTDIGIFLASSIGGSPSGYVELRSGTPTGTLLGTSAVASGSSTSTAAELLFRFNTPVAVTSSSVYCAVFYMGNCAPAGTVHGNATNTYAGGAAYGGGIQGTDPSVLTARSSAPFDFAMNVYRRTASATDTHYIFGFSTNATRQLQALKATDPTTSWAAIGSNPAITGNLPCTALAGFQVGTVIHLLAGISGSNAANDVRYYTFNTATDAWGVINETVVANTSQTGAGGINNTVSLVVRSGGDVVAFFNGAHVKTSGTFYNRVYYSRRTGVAAWSAAIQVDANTAIDNVKPTAVLGPADVVHFIWGAGNNNSQRTLTALNALQTASATISVNGNSAWSQAVSYLSGATTKVVTALNDGTNCNAVRFDSANTPTMTNAVIELTAGAVRLFVDGTDVYALYRASADSDLYVEKSTDHGATWSGKTSAFVGTVAAGQTVLSMDGRIYQRGASVLIPYVVNDNSVLKYNEYLVRTIVPPVDDAWSNAEKSANVSLSNSDKTATLTSAVLGGVLTTQKRVNGAAGKFSAEFTVNGTITGWGAGGQSATAASITDSATIFGLGQDGQIYIAGGGPFGSLGVINVGDVVSLDWDTGAELIWFRRNEGLYNGSSSADPATGVGGVSISSMPNVAYGLFFNSSALNSGSTIRTEAAEFTQTKPVGFLSWMGETLVVPDLGTLVAGSSTVAGAGVSGVDGTGALSAQSQTGQRGAGVSSSTGTGALTAVASGRTNYLPWSDRQEQWSANFVTATANATTAPDGSNTADKIAVSNNSTNASHYSFVWATPGTGVATCTYSFYAKPSGNYTWVQLYGLSGWANFNLTGAGATGNKFAGAVSSITGPDAYGFYRCSLTMAGAGGTTQFAVCLMRTDNATALPAYLPIDTTDSVYLWGGQVEVGSVATAYIPTAGAAASSSETLVGFGTVVTVTFGTGALAADVADLDAVGLVQSPPVTGTGALVSVSTLAGAGVASSAGTGAVVAVAVTGQRGAGVSSSVSTSAALIGTVPTLAGAGISQSVNTVAALAAVSSTGQRGAGASASSGTAALAAQVSTTVAAGVSASSGTGALPGTVSILAASGSVVSGISGTGALTSFSVLSGAGVSRSISTSAVLTSPPVTVTAVAVGQSAGVATLSAAASALASVGAVSSLGIATLASQSSATVGAGIARHVATGTLGSASVVVSGSGQVRFEATGALNSYPATATGSGKSASGAAAVALQATVASISGFEGTVVISGTGSVPAQSSGLSGVAIARSLGTGALIGPTAALAGTGLSGSVVTGTLVSQVGVVTAPGKSSSSGSGALVSGISSLAGSGAAVAGVTGTGILSATVGDIDGLGGSLWVATGAISAQASVVAASGLSRWIATGALSASPSTATGAGSSLSIVTAAALQAARSTVLGSEGIAIISGTGSVPAQSAKAAGVVIGGSVGAAALTESAHFLDGEGTSQSRGQGVLADQNGSLSGSGVSIVDGSAALVSTASDLTGAGVILAKVEGSGTLTSLPATLAGFANLTTAGAGALSVQTSVVHGSGLSRSTGWGVPRPVRAVIEAEGLGQSLGTGVMVSRRALMLAFGKVEAVATGSLQARDAKVAGFQVGVVTGIGVIVSGAGVIVGQGYVGVPERPSTPLPPSYPGTRPWGGVGYTSTFSGVTRTWTNPGTRPWRRVA
jgi:hypothetical protein